MRASPKPFTFYPPKTSPFVIRLAKMGIRRSIRRQLRVTEIDIGNQDLDRLRNLKGERCLLTPSHSGGFEPHIILYLSKLVDDIFNYVAAIELFEQAPAQSLANAATRGLLDHPRRSGSPIFQDDSADFGGRKAMAGDFSGR